MVLSRHFTKEEPGESWWKYVPTEMATSYLFTLQLGEHPDNVRLNGLRLQTLVLSFFTALFFIYYTGELSCIITTIRFIPLKQI